MLIIDRIITIKLILSIRCNSIRVKNEIQNGKKQNKFEIGNFSNWKFWWHVIFTEFEWELNKDFQLLKFKTVEFIF